MVWGNISNIAGLLLSDICIVPECGECLNSLQISTTASVRLVSTVAPARILLTATSVTANQV